MVDTRRSCKFASNSIFKEEVLDASGDVDVVTGSAAISARLTFGGSQMRRRALLVSGQV